MSLKTIDSLILKLTIAKEELVDAIINTTELSNFNKLFYLTRHKLLDISNVSPKPEDIFKKQMDAFKYIPGKYDKEHPLKWRYRHNQSVNESIYFADIIQHLEAEEVQMFILPDNITRLDNDAMEFNIPVEEAINALYEYAVKNRIIGFNNGW